MRYAVDAVCFHKTSQKFVFVNRLSFPLGLALPGGGIELGESKEVAIVREVKEETGLDFTVISWLEKIYDTKNRDPRGDATSYVAYGYVEGFTQHEPGKTEVVFLSREDVLKQKNSFAFDHFEIFTDFLSSVSLC